MSFKKGNVPWNKGTKGVMKAWNKGKKGCVNSGSFKVGHVVSQEVRDKLSMANVGKEYSEEYKKNMSMIKKGQKHSDETKRKISKRLTGRKLSEEHRLKLSKAFKGRTPWNKGITGEESHSWKGDNMSFNRKLRRSSLFKIWREAVYLRDNFTCQNPNCEFCNNKIGAYLHSHHIKPLSLFPELAFKIDNGITYCAEFHLKSGLHKNIQENEIVVGVKYGRI